MNHTILTFGKRLQNLEESFLDSHKFIKRVLENGSGGSSPSRRVQTPSSRSDNEDFTHWDLEFATKPEVPRKRGRFLKTPDDRERYFEPTSLDSVILDTKDFIADSVQPDSFKSRETLKQAQSKIDLLFRERQEDAIRDASMPTIPPSAVLEAMIDPYFTTINSSFPIWTKEKFCQMSSALRTSNAFEQNLASIICCNNVIILALSAHSFNCRKVKLSTVKQADKVSSSDANFIRGFLANAKRALKHLDQLMSPCLINVQALLSLYIVSQMFLASEISEMLLTLAARCAKSVGIHQWHTFRDQLSDQDVKERRSLCYCLYIFEKSFCWSSASSPNLVLSEVYIEPRPTSCDSITSSLITRTKLAKIVERIYFEMYADRIESRTTERVRQCALAILSSLQDWSGDAGLDINEIQKSAESSSSKIELSICFLSAKLLLIWPNEHLSDAVFQQKHQISRTMMKLLLSLWNLPPEQDHHIHFPLFLASIPPLYLREILVGILSGQESDVSMLREFIEIMQVITDHQDEASYNVRLCELLLIVMDVITARSSGSRHKRSKSTSTPHTSSTVSDHASLYGLVPGNLSPISSNYVDFPLDINTNGYEGMHDSMRGISGADRDLVGSSNAFLGDFAKNTPESLKGLIFGVDFLTESERESTYSM